MGYAFPLLSLSNFISVRPTDSSVGRAEDCRWLLKTGILRSLVQIRLGGHFQCCKSLKVVLFSTFENPCQKWDSNPRPHSWTRMLLCLQRKRLYSWVWRLRPLGHPDMYDCEFDCWRIDRSVLQSTGIIQMEVSNVSRFHIVKDISP